MARQRELLSGHEAGIRDRDLRVEYLTGPEPGAAQARKRRSVAVDEFAVILIGRDGGEKLCSTGPIFAAELFGKIDDMPMRRREQREREQRERR